MSLPNVYPETLGDTICEAWSEDLTISEIPNLLGISRPTFYKLLKAFYSNGNTIRFIPNFDSLGYDIIVIKNKAPGGFKNYKFLYIKREYINHIDELLRTLGINAIGIYKLDYILCSPRKIIFSEPRSKNYKPTELELKIIKELSIKFTHSRELATKLNIPWQKISSILQKLKEKELLLSPIIIPTKSMHAIGAIIRQDKKPNPLSMVNLAPKYSTIVLSSITNPLDYIIVTMTSPQNIMDYAENSIRNNTTIKEIILVREHALPPFVNYYIIGDITVDKSLHLQNQLGSLQIPVKLSFNKNY